MKKLLSMLLAAIIMMTCLPLTAFADDTVMGDNTKRYTVLLLNVADQVNFLNENEEIIYTADSAIEYVKQSAIKFLTDLVSAAGENHVAVIAYAEEARIVSDFTTSISSVRSKVNELAPEHWLSNVDAALRKADSLLDDVTEEDAVKNIILVTTGMVNAGGYNYEGQYNENTTGSGWERMDTGIRLYAYANSALATAEPIKGKSTIYVLGLFQTVADIPTEGKPAAALFRRTARDLASFPNTFYNVTDPSKLDFAFGSITDTLLSAEGSFRYAGQINSDYDTEATYFYSDTYFLKSAKQYNPSLATMSLCLELSCWSSHDKKNWYNPSISPSQSGFWDDRLCNAKTLLLGGNPAYPDNDYDGLGFTDFQANSCWEQAPTLSSIGVCAARKQLLDSEGRQYTLIALAIRGGGYGAEWGGNFSLGETGQHEGFSTAKQQVVDFLDDYIRTLRSNESKKLKIWVTGYSRAGGTANLVAAALDFGHYFPNGTTTNLDDIYCYTFEAPQGGVASSMTRQYPNIHNVLNLSDLVPLVAPSNWDFARYNHDNDIKFPTAYTSSNYATEKGYMKAELAEMGFGSFDYDIQEILNIEHYNLNLSNLRSPRHWDEIYYKTNVDVDSHTALVNGINLVAGTVIPSRKYFADNLQADVERLVMNFMNSYKTETNNYDVEADDYAIENLKKKLPELLKKEVLLDVIKPLFSPNPFKSWDDRTSELKTRLKGHVREVFGDEFVGKNDTLMDALIDIIVSSASTLLQQIGDSDLSSINTGLDMYQFLGAHSGMQAHFPEVTLAWVRSLDHNYNQNVPDTNPSANTRIVRINCPVDVEVLNADGERIAAMYDNAPDQSLDGIVYYYTESGEKLFYLPGDGDYTINIIATDDGTLNYSVSEFNYNVLCNTRIENYYDIPIRKGDYLQADVPALDEPDTTDVLGSDADYLLEKNGAVLEADETIAGAETAGETYNVTVETEGNGGAAYCTGSSYTKGSFAKVQATTWNTGKFLGWYDGNTLLSSQPEYRFAVKDHTTITAKFNEINFHSYTLKVEGGGTIQQDEYEWPANASLPMEATPDEGYEFVCWTSSNGGTFENASDSITSFTMPDHDTEITAHFRKIGEKPDLNKDDTVNMADVVMLFRYVSEDAPEALDETKLLAADMDADGTLTLTDLKLLLASLTAA